MGAATLRVDIVTDAKQVGSGVDQATSKLGKLGKIGSTAAKGLGVGLAAAGAVAVKFGADSIASASAVQQSFGALETVYGKSAGQVKKWAAGAADSVGLAKSEYAELSSLVGSQLQGMGVEQDKSAKRSHNLIKMGADLAATYGGSVSDAVGAVSSLLKGEADPIERYGVSIKASDVNARLAAKGLDHLTGKAEKQARATETLSMLTKQTSRAHGAFRKESGTLAGQQERLRAKFENVKATIGKKLLPIATSLTSWVSDKALPRLSRLGNYLVKNFGPAFRAVGDFIKNKAIPAARDVYRWFVDKIAPGIRKTLTPVLEGGKRAFDKVRDAIDRNRPQLEKLLTAVKKVAEWVADDLAPVLGKTLGKALEIMGDNIGNVIDVISRLVDWIDDAIDGVRDLINWVKDIKAPKVDLNPFNNSAGEYAVLRPRLVGDSPSYDGRRGWSTAALGTGLADLAGYLRGPTAPPTRSGPAVVYAPQITVQGAVDPVSTARQIRQLLADDARRFGLTS